MPVASSCPYYGRDVEECVSCIHGAFHECRRYRHEMAMRRVSCLGSFRYESTGFGVEAHRKVMVVWGTDGDLLRDWILEDSMVGRFSVVRMDMVEVKTLVMYEEGSYDDRIESLGVSVNNGGGIYLDLSGIANTDVYDKGNTIFAVLRNFVFLCVARSVRVYLNCSGDMLDGMSAVSRGAVISQNVFLSEYMTGGVGYRLMRCDGHNLLVSTPESRYLRCGVGERSVMLGLVPWQKWLLGKKSCRYVVSGGGSLSEKEERLMRSAPLDGSVQRDTLFDKDSVFSSRLKLFTDDVDYSVGKRVEVIGDDSSVKSDVDVSAEVGVRSQMDFIEKVRDMRGGRMQVTYGDGEPKKGRRGKGSIDKYL